ncbi:MAG: adenylate/guanylate cyclase domain-containing protein [Ferruginibacter sp.]
MEIEFAGEKIIEIIKGQSVLDASLSAGIPHFHACGGKGRCSTCRILILEGLENLSPINRREALLRNKIPFPNKVRLACQTTLNQGPVKIERIIKDEIDFSLFLEANNLKAGNRQLGEEKELVLFFLDIRNFTPFVETYLPFDVIHIIRRLFFIFHKVINDHKGEIIETAGDGFYVVFGLTTNTHKAADNALSASQLIIKELKEFNETYLNEYFFIDFEVGIGIHLGKVIVGNIKIGDENNASVMGLAVNIASRLQTSTRELNNNVVVSEALLRHSSYTANTQTKEINLKGIHHSIIAHLIGEPFKN